MTDDEGIGDVGVYGAKDLRTPNMDALANSGARFTSWYSAAPMCSPSRAAVMTGRYPIRAGVRNIVNPHSDEGLPGSEVTLAKLLKAQGYTTGIIGKWHLGDRPESRPNAQGFDYFFGFLSGCLDYYSDMFYWVDERRGQVNFHDLWRNNTEIWEDPAYLTELITAEAKRFIAANKSRPFFLFVPYNAPHYPMLAPQKYIDRYPDLPRQRRVYAAMVSAVDDGIGEITEEVRKAGLTNNTLVFFQSDNGATIEARQTVQFSGSTPRKCGSNAPFRGYKFSLFEGGIRMPAWVSWPGTIPAGQVIHEVGIGMDIFVTAAKAAGARIPSDRIIDGRDIMPMVTQNANSPHDVLFWLGQGGPRQPGNLIMDGEQIAVRKGKWKLILNGILGVALPTGVADEDKMKGDDLVFLVDVENDPGETTNLRFQHPDVVEELTHLVKEWRAQFSARQMARATRDVGIQDD
jgi:arylsulfatase A-like enzyme